MDPVTALARPPARPRRVEYALTGVLVVWAVLEAVSAPAAWPVGVGVALAWSLPVLLVRIAPAAGLAVVLAVFVAHAAFGPPEPPGAMPMPAILLLTFGAGLWVARPAWSVTAGVAAAAAVVGVQVAGYYTADGGQFAVAVFFVAGAWTTGRMIHHRARQLHLARDEAARSAAEAVTAERARLARELHDVVAHAVSVIAVQAGAAEDVLDGAPDRARVHLGHVRAGAREALVEMRRLLEVLDPDRDPAAARDPLPGVAGLDDLVDATRAAGTEVSLRHIGTVPALPAALDLALYRIVQEALTNVRRHAAGSRAEVTVRWCDRHVEVRVHDTGGARDPSVAPGGRGLAGMAERVRVFGGALDAGPDGGGGFLVHARLPLEGTA